MKVRDAILLICMGIVLTVAVGGYLFWESQSKKPKQQSLQTQPTSTQNATPQPTSPLTQATGSNLQIQGVTTQNNAPSGGLPEPVEFSQYDQYATSEGVLYTDIIAGNGDAAQAGDVAAVLYKGWLTDGQLFDQTKKNEEGKLVTYNFKIGGGQVIAGWDQGVAGMRVGGKRRLVIPPAFGYGAAGQGPIPANAVLVFDVELVALNPNMEQPGL